MQGRTTPLGRQVNAAPVRKKLSPGAAGTLKLMQAYGDALVCVRYRRDALQVHRYTTVEVVVDAGPVEAVRHGRVLLGVHVDAHDKPLRRKLMAAAGVWDAQAKLWWLGYGTVVRLRLMDRVRARG